MRDDPRIERIYPIYQTGSYPIAMLRNRAACMAIENGCDYLLMIDNDMVPDVPEDGKPFWGTAWEYMMNRRTWDLPPATVAAPYFCDAGRGFYTTSTSGEPIGREDALSRTGITEVGSTQTGLILYDTRVFARIEPPWFDFQWQDPHHVFMIASEDHYQTRKSTAHGCPVYVAWDCWAGHMKTHYVTRPPVQDV